MWSKCVRYYSGANSRNGHCTQHSPSLCPAPEKEKYEKEKRTVSIISLVQWTEKSVLFR